MTASPKRIKVYRFRSRDETHNNFGDEITIPILDRIFGIEAVPSSMQEAELLGAGSILDHWQRRRRRPGIEVLRSFRRSSDLHVWGSGFILPEGEAVWPQQLHFHAVRGELTAARTDKNAILGDPGILASLLVRKDSPQYAVGLVAHVIDIASMTSAALPKNWRLISPAAPVDDVLRSIASCDLIVSSSLHGLISADSFGIPCVWAKTDKPLYGDTDFKFRDYMTGRRALFNDPLSYQSLFARSTNDLADLATTPGRGIEPWQKQLIAAFPEAI